MNRRFLAVQLAAAGRLSEADEQLSEAQQNVADEAPDWPHSRRLFEMSITGRTGYRIRQRLQELRDRLFAGS
jgi:hypothetical protein